MALEFREIASTKKIHIFDSNDQREGHKPIPICQAKIGGGITYPLDSLEDVEGKRVCKRCLNHSSKH